MKNFCLDLREHATKIMNYENKEIIPLTNEEKNIPQAKRISDMQKKDFVLMMMIIKSIMK